MEQVEDQLGNFDFHKVVIRDEKSGRVVNKNPYRAHVVKGVRYIEHPAGSGNLYFENKQPAGRLNYDKDGGIIILKGAKHEAWTPPKTEDQSIGEANAVLKMENERLLKELSAIKLEQQHTEKAEAPKVAKSAKDKA